MELRNEGGGRPRFQSRKGRIRTLHLCDECFERLPAHHLNDLFLRFVFPSAATNLRLSSRCLHKPETNECY